jgi:hypothetical protein
MRARIMGVQCRVRLDEVEMARHFISISPPFGVSLPFIQRLGGGERQ